MLRIALPLTDWWANTLSDWDCDWGSGLIDQLKEVYAFDPSEHKAINVDAPILKRFIDIVGSIALARQAGKDEVKLGANSDTLIRAFAEVFAGVNPPAREKGGLLWSISNNRPAKASVYRSRLTVKADAATLLFKTKAAGIRWAILDTGIDATHPAFQKLGNRSVTIAALNRSRTSLASDFADGAGSRGHGPRNPVL